jgi:hypothetical protein
MEKDSEEEAEGKWVEKPVPVDPIPEKQEKNKQTRMKERRTAERQTDRQVGDRDDRERNAQDQKHKPYLRNPPVEVTEVAAARSGAKFANAIPRN